MTDTKRKVKYPRPKWALEMLEQLEKQLGKRLELKFVHGQWHVHEYDEWWDPQKKKPVKISKYIGTLKKDGFYPKKRRYKRRKEQEVQKEDSLQMREVMKHEGSYEYGASWLFWHFLKDAY